MPIKTEILEEDISDEVLVQMHERALLEERKKFASVMKYPPGNRPRINRRTDSHADSSGTNTPINPTSPGPATEVRFAKSLLGISAYNVCLYSLAHQHLRHL